MTTKWCMNCESEYIASVERCPDCDLALVDKDPEEADAEVEAAGRGGQFAYELHEWAVESRVMLEQLLEGAGIPRAWEGTNLVIPAALEATVDELVDQVAATTLPTLDPDAPKLVYELEDWTDDDVTRLAEALDAVELSYEFDLEGNLVILEEDEERVEAMLESIEYPDALKPDVEVDDDYDDIDMAEVLGDLFVAADRLKNHARDHEGVLGLVRAAGVVVAADVPFGFAPAVWQDIVGQAERLRAGIEGDEQSDEEIEEHAGELRSLLRQYV